MLANFKVYQMSKKFFLLCNELKIRRFLHEQLIRAASSVALNIAEGSGKRTPSDQRRFYGIAHGSLRECQAILDLEQIEDPEILDLAHQIGAILFKLSRPENPQRPSHKKL